MNKIFAGIGPNKDFEDWWAEYVKKNPVPAEGVTVGYLKEACRAAHRKGWDA